VGRIVEIQLGRLRHLLAERQITLALSEPARESIADAGYDPQYGARPLKRALQRLVQDPLATKILRGEVKAGDHVTVDEGPDGAIRFQVGPPPAEGTVQAPAGGTVQPPARGETPPPPASRPAAKTGGKGPLVN